ncbi:hypothetical protein [Xylella fastidiosa]|nr:hypothetical protein [Xylella fastidiosa]MDG4872832.1 hypothetical protein [Xylella fastidiosa subsp. multiplex]
MAGEVYRCVRCGRIEHTMTGAGGSWLYMQRLPGPERSHFSWRAAKL